MQIPYNFALKIRPHPTKFVFMKPPQKTIGELIENEVRKQQMSITKFASEICCQRNNVYDIFKRSKIDIVQLKQISKVLKRNFFKELAEDADLINDREESEEEANKVKAVGQFLNVVPDILRKLERSSAIVFSQLDEPGYDNCPTPDFGLSDYFITFTIGETLKERIGECSLLPIRTVSSDDGCRTVEICTNIIHGSVCLNIKLDFKTADEWFDILAFAFNIYDNL